MQGIDHLVIMFKELEPAIAAYRDLGFTVVPGGEHPAGTHNALIAFADGSELELIAFKRPNDQHRWWDVAQAGGGFIDFCVVSDDVAADIRAFRDAGAKVNDPVPGGRVRTDGVKLSWVTASAPKPFMFQVPFFIQDHTPREERIPKQKNHANGVAGIASITVATDDVARVRGWWSPVLHQPGADIQRDEIDAAGVRFIAGTHALDFVGPRSASSPIDAWLKARGPSPYGIALKTSSGKTGPLDEAKAGTRITLV
ncbi:VOC family protein [Bradyrhizobium zhanjiangense]|uniref:VOC family protein n=1 Tax=Bradyrhizobium zhanjiangense TaxID=1325107 RepID=UPI0013E899CC|nr:VOC family protein [Bradyrhizobium zhanjiangense]